MDPIGTIITTDDTPTADTIAFVVTDTVRRGQFVSLTTDDGTAIARVSSVQKTNILYTNPESITDAAETGKSLADHFPSNNREQLIAKATVLGVYQKNNLVKRPSYPPSPGTDVYTTPDTKLADFLGLDMDSGIHIGDIQFQNLNAQLNLTDLFQKHIAILAQSGAGKSYLASVIIEELLDRNEANGQIGIVAIDPHGEYAGFAKDSTYSDRVEVYSGSDIQLSLSSLTAGNLQHYFPNVSSAQKREISKILRDLKGEMKQGNGVFTLNDLEKRVEEADMPTKTQQIWLDRIRTMHSMDIFKRYDNPATKRIEPGKMIVLDLSDIIYDRTKQIITAYFGDKLFRQRRQGRIPPYLFLVEEAHNFAPENKSTDQAIARSTITKIAREGRKFHASLGLISQRPVGLSATALSQCNTHIILRVTNPYDQDRIKQSSEGITSDVINQIASLRVGECVVVGEAVDYPAFISVRKRRSEEFETGKNLEDAALQYKEAQEIEDNEIDAFM